MHGRRLVQRQGCAPRVNDMRIAAGLEGAALGNGFRVISLSCFGRPRIGFEEVLAGLGPGTRRLWGRGGDERAEKAATAASGVQRL